MQAINSPGPVREGCYRLEILSGRDPPPDPEEQSQQTRDAALWSVALG
jgi:hypothetical protein